MAPAGFITTDGSELGELHRASLAIVLQYLLLVLRQPITAASKYSIVRAERVYYHVNSDGCLARLPFPDAMLAVEIDIVIDRPSTRALYRDS